VSGRAAGSCGRPQTKSLWRSSSPQKGRVGEGDHGQPEEGLFGMTGWARLSRPVLPGLGLTLGVRSTRTRLARGARPLAERPVATAR
jgi:hypothetical protein